MGPQAAALATRRTRSRASCAGAASTAAWKPTLPAHPWRATATDPARTTQADCRCAPPPATRPPSAALARHADRLARGLAVVINLLDPDAIVLGGGLSNMDTCTPSCRGCIPHVCLQRHDRDADPAEQAWRFVRRARRCLAVAGRLTCRRLCRDCCLRRGHDRRPAVRHAAAAGWCITGRCCA